MDQEHKELLRTCILKAAQIGDNQTLERLLNNKMSTRKLKKCLKKLSKQSLANELVAQRSQLKKTMGDLMKKEISRHMKWRKEMASQGPFLQTPSDDDDSEYTYEYSYEYTDDEYTDDESSYEYMEAETEYELPLDLSLLLVTEITDQNRLQWIQEINEDLKYYHDDFDHRVMDHIFDHGFLTRRIWRELFNEEDFRDFLMTCLDYSYLRVFTMMPLDLLSQQKYLYEHAFSQRRYPMIRYFNQVTPDTMREFLCERYPSLVNDDPEQDPSQFNLLFDIISNVPFPDAVLDDIYWGLLEYPEFCRAMLTQPMYNKLVKVDLVDRYVSEGNWPNLRQFVSDYC